MDISLKTGYGDPKQYSPASTLRTSSPLITLNSTPIPDRIDIMVALDFLNKSFFSPRFMLPIHLLQLVLIAAAMGLSVPRLFMKNQPRTRANTIALGMVRSLSAMST